MTEASEHNQTQCDVLFVGEHALWPIDQGFCIRGVNITRALTQLGVRVRIASIAPLPDDAPDDLQAINVAWPEPNDDNLQALHASWAGLGSRLRHRVASYQGRDLDTFAGVVELVRKHQPRYVVGLGQHSPLMLRAIRKHSDAKCVWYAADEPMRFQLSCMRREPLAQAPVRLRKAGLYGALELAFVRGLDGAIGVSPAETRALRYIAGAKQAVTLRNGVDLNYFKPEDSPREGKSLVFWGRLDFEPNIDAVTWFAREVWPKLHLAHRGSTFQIIGKHPAESVQALSEIAGVDVVGEVEDIRPHALNANVTILPMRCGGGIKNKLLEASAMGLTIVASPRAVRGLEFYGRKPIAVCQHPDEWVRTIHRLWQDMALSRQLGASARAWVEQEHNWTAAGQQFWSWLNGLNVGHTKAARDLDFAPPQERFVPSEEADDITATNRAATEDDTTESQAEGAGITVGPLPDEHDLEQDQSQKEAA